MEEGDSKVQSSPADVRGQDQFKAVFLLCVYKNVTFLHRGRSRPTRRLKVLVLVKLSSLITVHRKRERERERERLRKREIEKERKTRWR